jgi:YidC/Oxa1 family membrane protein insertase
VFDAAAWLVNQFYSLTHNYAIAIALVALVIMLLITPLTLKSTKGMLEMQTLQPEMRRLQQQYKNDRQKLNEEMMNLYQEHKVNPLASCLPLLAQMPVFIIMFRVLHGLTRLDAAGKFDPQYLGEKTELYKSLKGKTQMLSFGLDLAEKPLTALQDNFVRGLPYLAMVVALAGLFLIQQKMIASRNVSPTMSATQAKVMQYLPVAFAAFQLFLPTGLVVYYATQAVIRIVQQGYITKRFYGSEHAIGRKAQEASAKAREISEKSKKDDRAPAPKEQNQIVSKRITPPKNKPTPSGNKPKPSGGHRHPKPPSR